MATTLTDLLILSNAPTGTTFHDSYFRGMQSNNEASALTGSFIAPVGGPMQSNGHVVDFWIGVVTPATSASGFVSGTATATPGINSVSIVSTAPSILMAGSAGQAVRTNTQTSTAQTVKTVMGPLASCRFSVGDQLTVAVNMRSVGSAAAGAAGSGLTWVTQVRFAAN